MFLLVSFFLVRGGGVDTCQVTSRVSFVVLFSCTFSVYFRGGGVDTRQVTSRVSFGVLF